MIDAEFIAVPANRQIIAELSARAPANPFATASFFESRRRVGCSTWVLGLRDNAGALECGCGAFLRRGRLDRTLVISSLPAVGADSSFWSGLRDFCAQHAVTKLELGTFGSPPGVEIPRLSNHGTSRSRSEFVLGLAADLATMLSANHRRNVKRAQQAGLVVWRTQTAEGLSVHQALMTDSIDRRRRRGENIPGIRPSPEHVALLESGAGELYQALRAGTVLSSALVLLGPKGGYHQSAGTSPDGMAVGASHFLIHSIALQLSAEGAQIFNLGGADEGSGLARFKEGFGASRVPLPSANFYLGAPWRRWASRGIASIRADREKLLRLLIARMSHLTVPKQGKE